MKKVEAIIKPHKVFVSSLDDVVRVRTGEHGERAL